MAPALTVNLPEFLEDSDGEVRIVGHRISLYNVLVEYNAGESAEGIVLKFPSLKLATVYKLIGFYLDYQPEIDGYLADYRKTLEEQASRGSTGPSKAELLRRLEQIRLKAQNAAHVSH